MSSIGASYAPVHLMQKQLKEKITKREEKDQSVAVVETSLATADRNSNKVYPSRSTSYNEQASNRKSKTSKVRKEIL
ncbi:hypothetical protein N665_0094s0055 [Sinapis alba]|nr:hypothetical protein N665_0094s0055 [Sinapis alba]